MHASSSRHNWVTWIQQNKKTLAATRVTSRFQNCCGNLRRTTKTLGVKLGLNLYHLTHSEEQKAST
jgi:hypothetical protein